ncbi:MAG: GHMP kinase [Aquihabitans sp.]
MRRVVATAPVRVCDVGGWTDTWFGSPGQVCSVAVGPGVEVVASLVEAEQPVRLIAPALGEDYFVGPSDDADVGWMLPLPGRQALLEHAIAEVVGNHTTARDRSIEVTINSSVPPGASLGTSAAVLVALLGALEALLVDTSQHRDPAALARLAHSVETGRAGREAGVQDQWAAAMGGCLFLAVGPYPEVRAERLDVPSAALAALGGRLVTVVFGPHDSSAVHGEVSHALLSCDGPEHHRSRDALRRLASLARDAADALVAGDIDRWAGVLVESTSAQATLHPGLVGPDHAAAIQVARACGASGWKVNGAGGAGGSLTMVAGPGGATALRDALASADPTWQIVDLRPSGGLEVRVDTGP